MQLRPQPCAIPPRRTNAGLLCSLLMPLMPIVRSCPDNIPRRRRRNCCGSPNLAAASCSVVNGRGRGGAAVQTVRFSRHVLFLCCCANHSVPTPPGSLPKPRRAAFSGFLFLGPAPTAEQRLIFILPSAPRKRRRNVSVTNARHARQETGRRMPEYSKSWPRDPAGHTKCTHRSTQSPL